MFVSRMSNGDVVKEREAEVAMMKLDIEMAELEARKADEEHARLLRKAKAEVKDVIETLSNSRDFGHDCWILFTQLAADFGKPSLLERLDACSSNLRIELRKMLLSRGVYVEIKRGLNATTALKTCLESTEAPIMDDEAIEKLKQTSNQDSDLPRQGHAIEGRETRSRTVKERYGDRARTQTVETPAIVNSPDGEDGGDDDDGGSSDNGHESFRGRGSFRPSKSVAKSTFTIPVSQDQDPSHAISLFTKLYSSERDKYDGDPDSSFPVYRTTLLRNVLAAKVESEEAASVVHKTLTGNALSLYILRFGTRQFDRIEEALACLGEIFEDDTSTERAYELFQHTKFAIFRRQKSNRDLTEAEVVKLFYSNLLSWQMQLDMKYHDDIHLRDRLVSTFSEHSEKLKDAFLTKRPRTSQQALQRIIKRASYEARFDLLPDKDADVLRSESQALYIQNKMRGYSKRSESRQRKVKKPRGPKRGCWVCKSKDHYAHQQHSADEVAAAKKKGNNVFSYVATLSNRRRVRVLQAYQSELQSSTEDESVSDQGDYEPDGDADVAEVSDANITITENEEVDSVAFNRSIAANAADSAFVLSIASTWDSRMKDEMKTMTRRLSADEQSFGGIVLDSACTGASVVSANEYQRYCRETGAEYCIEPNSSGYVRFGNARKGDTSTRVKPLGQARIRGYVETFDEVFEFFAHVIPGTDTPLLMSVQDLDGLGYDLRTGDRSLWSKDRKKT